MNIFGVLGYVMKKLEYEGAPMILALVLGPMFENTCAAIFGNIPRKFLDFL